MVGEPWIRVHARLTKRRVCRRLAAILPRPYTNDRQKAAGILLDFWPNVAEQSVDGFVGDADDADLEAWAEWQFTPGAFAAWVRAHHVDEDGRIKDWDDYMGALETRRAKDRKRKQRQREKMRAEAEGIHEEKSNGNDPDPSRGQSTGRHADVTVTSQRRPHPRARTVRDGTERDGTVRDRSSEKSSSSNARGRELLLTRIGELSLTRAEGFAKKLAQFEQGYDLPPGLGVPTAEQLDRACDDILATVNLSTLNGNTLTQFVADVMRPKDTPTGRSSKPRSFIDIANARKPA